MQVDRRAEHDVYVLGRPSPASNSPTCWAAVSSQDWASSRRVGEQGDLGPAGELAAADAGRAVAEDHLAQPDGSSPRKENIAARSAG